MINIGKKTVIPPNYLDTQNIQRMPITQYFTATDGQTVFNLSSSYELGKNQVSVEVENVPQKLGDGFTETSTTSITLSEGVSAGTNVAVRIFATPDGMNAKLTQLDQTSQTHTSQLADIVQDVNTQNGIDNTGVSDSTSALNTLILSLCKKTAGHKKIVFNGTYLISGTIFLPSDVVLDLNGSTLKGNGYNTNTMFQTGIYDGTTVHVYNDTNYVASVERAGVINGTIKDCGIGFDLTMMNRLCRFEHLYFINCERAMNANRCYYTIFNDLSYRSTDWNTKDASQNPAFNFQTENNAMQIKSVFVQSRHIGMQVYDVTSGINIDSCTFENCDTGFVELGNNIRNMKLSNCYFENCNVGAQMTVNAEIDNCFFHNCTTGITSSSGIRIYKTNSFLGCTTKIQNTQSPNAGSDMIELPSVITYDATPDMTIGADITNGAFGQVKKRNIQVYGNDPSQNVITDSLKGQSNTFAFAGKQGTVNGKIPFCTVTQIFAQGSTTSYSLQIDTSISWEQFSFIGYHFIINDNDNAWEMYGRIYGQIVKADDSTGKIIVLANSNGMLRITLSQFNHPTGYYGINGAVRHL